ncbi:unnamed protein product [Linum tenue]|uniref:F-box domain-containing protein n=1 Tax=Linum tenue TaxID=586396 RepID=A0AAV0JV80_9ROSI|nr:unnamed protein product [Linum tenue]
MTMNETGISCELVRNGKRAREEEEEDASTATDRLTHLPESIVCYILSLLSDTKSVVQTSVLSQAWRFVWKHVPILDLRSDSFQEYSSFQRYVENVLSRRGPFNVSKISYIDSDDSEDVDFSLFDKVVKYGLSHGTLHLVVDLDSLGTYMDENYTFSELFGTIPDCNLITMKIRAVWIDDSFVASGFSMLTTLHLEDCMLHSSLPEEFDPFSKFPCLNKLVLAHCMHHGRIKISGSQLLSLELDGMVCLDMEISAPRLKSLSLLQELEYLQFTKLSVPFLDHVDIQATDMNFFLEEDEECVRKSLISLFQNLKNAVSLSLGHYTVKVLSDMSEFLEQQPSPFTRLNSVIMVADSVPYTVINYFLKESASMKPKFVFV